MSQIVFRGKTYNSVFEMPDDIRQAYQIEKRKQPAQNNLTDFVDMSDEIREMYERARGTVDAKPVSSQPLSELPKTEDLFQQPKPRGKNTYSPSQTPNPPAHQAIEEDNGARRLALTIGILILLGGIAFFIMQYIS